MIYLVAFKMFKNIFSKNSKEYYGPESGPQTFKPILERWTYVVFLSALWNVHWKNPLKVGFVFPMAI